MNEAATAPVGTRPSLPKSSAPVISLECLTFPFCILGGGQSFAAPPAYARTGTCCRSGIAGFPPKSGTALFCTATCSCRLSGSLLVVCVGFSFRQSETLCSQCPKMPKTNRNLTHPLLPPMLG